MNDSARDLLRSYIDILNEAPAAPAAAAPAAAAPAPAGGAKPAGGLSQTTKIIQKTKQGLNTIGKALGAKGGVGQAAKGFEKIAQGKSVGGAQTAALQPFIEPLQKILANPQLKQRFLALAKAADQGINKIDPTAQQPADEEPASAAQPAGGAAPAAQQDQKQ